jgi:hypothetical protein
MKRITMMMTLLAGMSGAAAHGTIPFGELDVNRDDALTRTEAGLLPDIMTQWQRLDRDGDGRLNRGEYAGYWPPANVAGAGD